jgi:hypothetical protein
MKIENPQERIAKLKEAIRALDAIGGFVSTTDTLRNALATETRSLDNHRREKLITEVAETILAAERTAQVPPSAPVLSTHVRATIAVLEDMNVLALPSRGYAVLDPVEIAAVNTLLEDILFSRGTLDSAASVRGLFDGIADTIERAQQS